MTSALLFPGQGAQRPGMLSGFREPRIMRELAFDLEELLGLTLQDLERPENEKNSSSIQVSLFLMGVASFRALEERGASFDVVAGFSIGAYSAAVASGAFSFRDLLPIVALRGARMQQAYPSGYGMLAVLGLRADQLRQMLADAGQAKGAVYLANVNSTTQTVLAGELGALEHLGVLANSRYGAQTRLLDVPTPSHCELLSGVAAELNQPLATLSSCSPQIPYLSNVSTRLVWSAEAIRQDLIYNVARPVYWATGMELLCESGVSRFLEAAPGTTLTRLGDQLQDWPEAKWVSLDQLGPDAAARFLKC